MANDIRDKITTESGAVKTEEVARYLTNLYDLFCEALQHVVEDDQIDRLDERIDWLQSGLNCQANRVDQRDEQIERIFERLRSVEEQLIGVHNNYVRKSDRVETSPPAVETSTAPAPPDLVRAVRELVAAHIGSVPQSKQVECWRFDPSNWLNNTGNINGLWESVKAALRAAESAPAEPMVPVRLVRDYEKACYDRYNVTLRQDAKQLQREGFGTTAIGNALAALLDACDAAEKAVKG